MISANGAQTLWGHAWRAVVLGAVVVSAVWYGLQLRDRLWDWTPEVRFQHDINNGFNWGKRAGSNGFFSIYERAGAGAPEREFVNSRLDYAPLRLGLMTYWVSGLREQFTEQQLGKRQPTREFHAPLLWFNSFMELATAAGVFFTARHVARWRSIPSRKGRGGFSSPLEGEGREGGNAKSPVTFEPARYPSPGPSLKGRGGFSSPLEGEGREGGNAESPVTFEPARYPSPGPSLKGREGNPWPGTWIGLLAAIVTWFNPLILFNAHIWPQWDIWPMPFFIFAIYCCLRRWWLTAGLLIGFGATLKGQILMVAWTMPVFALLIGDWRGALKMIVGMVCATSIVGLPWEISTFDPRNQTLRAFDLLDRRFDYPAIAWVAGWIGFALLLPRRFSMTLVALAAGVSLWSTVWLFSGTTHWLKFSFGVGMWNYPHLTMGTTSNLPALLAQRFGWNNNDLQAAALTLPEISGFTDGPVSIRTLLLSIFILLSLACVILAAWHHRRRDPRIVIALCLPWLLFYTIPAQIHERYLLFISACAGLFLVSGMGWFLMGGALVLLGLISTVHAAVISNGIKPSFTWDSSRAVWGFVRYLCDGTRPGIAWALLLAAAVCVVGLCTTRKTGVNV